MDCKDCVVTSALDLSECNETQIVSDRYVTMQGESRVQAKHEAASYFEKYLTRKRRFCF